MGLPERIEGSLEPVDTLTCDIDRWLKVAPKAARKHLENDLESGRLSRWTSVDTPTAMTDSMDVKRIVGVIRGVKEELCPDCPQADCPTERVMIILQSAPLKRGAQIVIDGYFE